MSFRVILPEGLPNDQQALYAQAAVTAAQDRAAVEEARVQAHRDREKQIADSLAANAKEQQARREKAAKVKAEREAASFNAAIRAAFFEANTSATEADFLRNRDKLRDEALRERTLDQFKGRETLIEINKEILLRRGGYSGI